MAMREAYVIGTGMTTFGKYPESTIRSLSEVAVAEALADAGATQSDVQVAFFANGAAGILTGQEMIRGQVALRTSGLLGIPMVNVENACASGSSALYLANLAVASGAVEVALAVGAEKLTHPDKSKSFGALGAAVDLLMLKEVMEALAASAEKDEAAGTIGGAGSPGEGQPVPGSAVPAAPAASPASKEGPGGSGAPARAGHSPFMDVYAAWAETYMKKSGATTEDFARVVVKSRHNAARNPKAQFRSEVTLEEVLSSRHIAGPLTQFMCAPIGDGAAAVVVASKEWAMRHGADPVQIRAVRLVSGTDRRIDEPGATTRAAVLAYEDAGIAPGDVDVVELHDAAAPAELATLEELGLCAEGEAPKLVAAGETALGGRIPVNPSGGLLSRGHPIGATGCAQVVELADQLRGRCGERQVEGAKVALAENGGGFLGSDAAAMVVTVLSR
jgi:acetyl-CoA acyltransferase